MSNAELLRPARGRIAHWFVHGGRNGAACGVDFSPRLPPTDKTRECEECRAMWRMVREHEALHPRERPRPDRARDDVLHARTQGALSFRLAALERLMSTASEWCPYALPLYREAWKAGFFYRAAMCLQFALDEP